jgi:hypothetical protein
MLDNICLDAITHEQIAVDGIHVDAGISNLLKYLWTHGAYTDYSCQGIEYNSSRGIHQIFAYITFLEKDSFDIAWPLIVDLANSVGLQDSIDQMKWWDSHEFKWHVLGPREGQGRVGDPRVSLYMPPFDVVLLNDEAKHYG